MLVPDLGDVAASAHEVLPWVSVTFEFLNHSSMLSVDLHAMEPFPARAFGH